MKTIMLFFLATIFLSGLSCHLKWSESLQSEYTFSHYELEFEKKYETEEEHKFRELIFNYNLNKIREINSNPIHTWKAGVNHLTDRTLNEVDQLKGYNRDLSFSRKKFTSFQPSADFLQNLPENVDWRAKGVVNPPKNQGGCGSCWAFSSVSVLESHIALQTGKLFQLSEQQLVDCTKNPRKCGGTGGCSGATQELGFDYVTKSSGISLGKDYSYQGRDGTCQDENKTKVATIEGYVQLPANDYNSLMTTIATRGPVAISVDATNFFYYSSGIFNGLNGNCGSEINHAVVAVGYGSDNDKDYWIVRNSWGAGWGENGYIRIAREKDASKVKCEIDKNPASGSGCEGGPTEVTVCGTCGILSDSSIPTGGKLI